MSERDTLAMSDPAMPSNPERMICAYFDSEITDQQFTQLKSWLHADPANYRRFARWAAIHNGLYAKLRQVELAEFLNTDQALGDLELEDIKLDIDPKNVHALLQEADEVDQRLAREANRKRAQQRAAEEAAERRRQQQLDRLNRPRRSSYIEVPLSAVYLAGLAASVLVLFALQAMWMQQKVLQKPATVASGPAEKAVPAPTLASVVKSMQARWNDPKLSARSKTRLEAGPLVLDDGVVEIAFDEGARLVAEAPAAFELLSANRVRVTRGRVVAQVPEEAIGFTIVSDAAAIVDLGTEFGVMVDDRGEVSVHVLDGEVALAPKGQAVAGRRDTLLEGTARQIAGDGASVSEVQFDRAAFLREVPASPYELAVLRDRPIAFWRMNEPAGSSEVVSQGRLESLARVPHGIEIRTRADRPERGNYAAAFHSEHDGINLGHLPELALQHSFTIETWIRTPQSLEMENPQRIISTFQAAPEAGFAFGLIGRDWTGQSDLPSLMPIFTFYGVYDCIATAGLRPNNVSHFAVVVDSAGRPAFYVNGAPAPVRFRLAGETFARLPEQWDTTWTGVASSGPCYLGRNPPVSGGSYPPERFESLIDELAVFDKVLNSEDIRAHYKAGLSRGDPSY